MSGIVSVYVVFASHDEAHRIGRTVVGERLAACVNILGPCVSVFRWEGEIEEAEEFAAIFKTSAAQAALLIQRIGELHSYDVPAAVVWPIADVSDSYCHWVLENSKR